MIYHSTRDENITASSTHAVLHTDVIDKTAMESYVLADVLK